jgi:hypothetical protein
LRNHADGLAAMDLLIVPTVSFRLLFGFLILKHDRRRIYGTVVRRRLRVMGIRDKPNTFHGEWNYVIHPNR